VATAGRGLAVLAITLAVAGCGRTPLTRGGGCMPAQPSANPSVVELGGQLTVSSQGFDGCDAYADPAEYPLVMGTAGRQPPQPLGSVVVQTDGSFSTTITVPAMTTPGEAYLNLFGYRQDECDDSGSCAGYGSTIQIVSAP